MQDPQVGARPDSGTSSRFGAYEIERELGRGGMGVVYLARDRRLDRRVAIKSMTEARLGDPGLLARLQREARVLAALEHVNVAAIHAIEEADGQPYLVLEYVPGETLAEILARGPLPLSRALDVCAQIAAALEAVHARGIVHRDLKPANVKVTPAGVVKVLDFGLAKRLPGAPPAAEPSVELTEAGMVLGTVSYMSPEQLRGADVDARCDVWALGCLLYECLTARKAFGRASTSDVIAAILFEQPDWNALPASTPARVDGLLHRALSKPPSERPASAREFAAELPGSHALRAALAAGRMPTPEMVASAGGAGSLSPAAAISLFAAAVVLLAVLLVAGTPVLLEGREPLRRSPDELGRRASALLSALGWSATPLDTKAFFLHDYAFIAREREAGRLGTRRGRARATGFCYRASPEPLAPLGFDPSDELGDVTAYSPPLDRPGMATVFLDPDGRLTELAVVPPLRSAERDEAEEWGRLFEAAELDPAAFRTTDPLWRSPVVCDRRAAWIGVDPAEPSLELRVEAGASGDRPVYFKLFWPWTEPRGPPPAFLDNAPLAHGRFFAVAALVLAACTVLARVQARRGLADLRGGRRLAIAAFAGHVLLWLFEADHVSSVAAETHMFLVALGYAILDAAILAVIYVALEPFVRRYWPWRIIGMSRLLAGRVRDTMVCRDLAIGIGAGILLGVVERGSRGISEWLGGAPRGLMLPYLSILGGEPRYVVSMTLQDVLNGLRIAFVAVGVLFILFRVVRREWLAFALVFAGMLALHAGWLGGAPRAQPAWGAALIVGVPIAVFARFGLLALCAALATVLHTNSLPPIGAGGSWYLPNTLLLAGGFVAAAAFAAWGAVEAAPQRDEIPTER